MLSKRHVVALPLVLALSLPAMAGISRNVTQEDAAAGRVSVLVAAEGGGTIIDFSATQETVRKVSLDDPSKVVVDYSAPLPVIRLFRGSIPAADIPAVKQTQLTVITQDSDKQYHTYIFPVTPSLKPAVYTKFVVGGETQNQGVRRGTGVVLTTASGSIQTTASGVRQAEQQRTLVDPQLKGRVRRYLQLTQAGMSDRQAAKKAGISMTLVERLSALGQGTVSVAQSVPTPKPSVLPVLVVPAPTPKAAVVKVPKRPKPSRDAQSVVASTGAVTVKDEGTKTVFIIVDRVPEPMWSSATSASTVVAQPQSQSQRIEPVVSAKVPSHHDYANALLRGLNKARLDGKIRYGSRQWLSVNGAIRLLRRGASLDKAIAISGMQRDGFMKLLSAGGLVS